MAATTGFLLVGRAHPFGGGLSPTDVLSLSENSRPAWVCEPWPGGAELGSRTRIVWVPSEPERILADGLLMAGVHAIGDPAVTASFEANVGQHWLDERLDLGKVKVGSWSIVDNVLDTSPMDASFAVIALQGSSLVGQLRRLLTLESAVEVAVTSYTQHPGPGGFLSNSGELPE